MTLAIIDSQIKVFVVINIIIFKPPQVKSSCAATSEQNRRTVGS